MPWQSELLRFQNGNLTQHAAPGAMVENTPAGRSPQLGEKLAILVNLTPPLPHRSREIRVIAFETYWNSTGSVVARLRRALAAANRHLIQANAQSISAQRASGQISCVVFLSDELFLGQVGAAYVKLKMPDQAIELFPQTERPLTPLGRARPPLIHIGYAKVTPGSILELSTIPASDELTTENIDSTLKQRKQTLIQQLADKQNDGSIILASYVTEENAAIETQQQPRWWQRPKRKILGEEQAPVREPSKEPADAAPARPEPPKKPTRWKLPDWQFPNWQLPTLPRPKFKLPQLSWPTINLKKLLQRRRRWQLPRISLKPLWRALLPQKVAGRARRRTRPVPEEKKGLMGGVTGGFLLIILLITISTYLQFSGPGRAETIFAEAEPAWEKAYTTQTSEDWNHVVEITNKVINIDPHHEAAKKMQAQAESAIEALETAATLKLLPLGEINPSPIPHRLLVANSWLYWLNPQSDEVLGLRLAEDGTTPASDSQQLILKQGDELRAGLPPVGELVDFAWMEPHAGYPDGALFIYGDSGRLYIYEPTIGPQSLDEQQLKGELAQDGIAWMETFGASLYLVDRQQNQILKYLPVSGIYDAPPRPYFADQNTPQLQNVFAVNLDAELYLLFDNSELRTYFKGGEEQFQVEKPPSGEFEPTLMSISNNTEEGLIYLGDPKHECIVAINKEGEFQHKFRVIDKTLRSLAAMTSSTEPDVLYLIANNHLYAAPLPNFTAQ